MLSVLISLQKAQETNTGEFLLNFYTGYIKTNNMSLILISSLDFPNSLPAESQSIKEKRIQSVNWIKDNLDDKMTSAPSALFNLFRDYEIQMSSALQSELAMHFKGLERITALEIATDNGEVSRKITFGVFYISLPRKIDVTV